MPLLKYLFEFLRVYDFTTTPKDIKDNQNKSESRLINPSVLGLVFEKLNGYKEGELLYPKLYHKLHVFRKYHANRVG
ncbi:hypothetical protein VN0635_02190 [Helicobacter pylori]